MKLHYILCGLLVGMLLPGSVAVGQTGDKQKPKFPDAEARLTSLVGAMHCLPGHSTCPALCGCAGLSLMLERMQQLQTEEELVLQQLGALAKNKNAGFAKRSDAWAAAAKHGLPAKTAVPGMVEFLGELKVGNGYYPQETRIAMRKVLEALGVYGKDAEPAVTIVADYFGGHCFASESVNSVEDTSINLAAALTLGKIASPKCLPTVFKVMAEHRQASVRLGGVNALAMMAATKDFPRVKEVLAQLRVVAETDESSENRDLALKHLKALKNPSQGKDKGKETKQDK
jgi:hypothetical protein